MKDKVREQATPIVDVDFLSHLVLNFKAGCVQDHIANWIYHLLLIQLFLMPSGILT